MNLEPNELAAMEYIRGKYPNRWRGKLRLAWESGDYSDLTSDSRIEQALQTLRNVRGPSWLNNFKFPK